MNSARGSPGINRRVLLMATPALMLLGTAFSIANQARALTDPLPSWNDGAAKQAILGFMRE